MGLGFWQAMWHDVDGIKIAVDKLFQIYVNGSLEATLVASPSDLDDLALGFLYAEGYIESLDEVLELETSGSRIRVKTKGGAKSARRLLEECGGVEGRRRWALVEARADMERLRALVAEFGRFTMPSVEPSLAMHTSALLNGEWIVVHDVSRHSSMLKLVGRALKAGMRGGIAFTTGRASSDMVERAAAAGASIIVSIRGPLYSGVEAACRLGATLVANVRGKGLVPLCNAWRVPSASREA